MYSYNMDLKISGLFYITVLLFLIGKDLKLRKYINFTENKYLSKVYFIVYIKHFLQEKARSIIKDKIFKTTAKTAL